MLQTIQLPRPVYERLKRVAKQQNRSIPDAVDALIAQVESLPSLPKDEERELAALADLSDDTLWLLARSALTPEQQIEWERLNRKAQQGLKIAPDEQKRQETLLALYQYAALRRAAAMNLLEKRGHDVSALLITPTP